MISFSTKGTVLKELSGVLSAGEILPVFITTKFEFDKSPDNVVKKIQEQFNNKLVIIRSSADGEDSVESSFAGAFDSILDVDVNNAEDLKKAIKAVITSYSSESNNEVLIQPMLDNVKSAGVIFTSDVDTLAPYYIINYDESGNTDTVTGGTTNNLKTVVQYKNCPSQHQSQEFKTLIEASKECEKLFGSNHLDIEFAYDKNDQLYIFQVRPIVTKNKKKVKSIDLDTTLKKLYKKIEKVISPHPHIVGEKGLLGVMPDWNPAEIIGIKPKMLASSLYKELITDNIWAYQRDNYGYRNLRSFPLLFLFIGVPYIDVRASFNSFIPESLDDKLAAKLVNFYLNKLRAFPSYHDKIEFKIVHSCFYLNLDDKLKELQGEDFSNEEIKKIEESLLTITNDIINVKTGLYQKDLQKIEILKSKYNEIDESNLSLIGKIYWLVEDCKRFGTLPFAGIARAGFVAVQFLKSFVDLKIITQKEHDIFMSSLKTISKELHEDLIKYSTKKITKEEFNVKYGHLRPGTYDIESLRYDEGFDSYFSKKTFQEKEKSENVFTDEKLKLIDDSLLKNGIKTSAKDLICFITESIEGREYSKYVFTKSLSEVLRLVEKLGKKSEIGKNELAFLNINTILKMYSSLDHRSVYDILMADINEHKTAYDYTLATKLPSLITSPSDIYSFTMEKDEPNFITLKSVIAKVALEDEIKSDNIKGKVVFIKSADPGYDFLFTKSIAGIITQFGGANSHMAIRAAELGIPAVIGAGEKYFLNWKKAKVIEIDCSNHQVKVIS